MYQVKRLFGLVLGALLLVSLALGGPAIAKETESIELHLAPLNDSGVSGTATLTSVEGGVQVKLNMKGFTQPDIAHINHFHGGGTCSDVQAGKMAPVTIPLNPIVANENGTGSATSTIKDVTLEELQGSDQRRFILVHAKTKKGQGVPPGISCADLPQGSGNNGFQALPASGGPPIAVLFAIPLALISCVAGLILLRSRLGHFA